MSEHKKYNQNLLKRKVSQRAQQYPDNLVCAEWIKKASGAQTVLDVAIGGVDPLNRVLTENQLTTFADQLIERMVSVGEAQKRGVLMSNHLWDDGNRFILVMAPWIGRAYFDSVSPHLKGTCQYRIQEKWWENYTPPDWI
jgi:hypothetical protein